MLHCRTIFLGYMPSAKPPVLYHLCPGSAAVDIVIQQRCSCEGAPTNLTGNELTCPRTCLNRVMWFRRPIVRRHMLRCRTSYPATRVLCRTCAASLKTSLKALRSPTKVSFGSAARCTTGRSCYCNRQRIVMHACMLFNQTSRAASTMSLFQQTRYFQQTNCAFVHLCRAFWRTSACRTSSICELAALLSSWLQLLTTCRYSLHVQSLAYRSKGRVFTLHMRHRWVLFYNIHMRGGAVPALAHGALYEGTRPTT